MAKLTYDDKTNINPVVNRGTQSTAEDFNEIKASVNSIYDGVDDTRIPIKQGAAFANSPLYWDGTKLVSDVTIEIPPATLRVGEGMEMSAAGVLPIFRSLLTGKTYFPTLYEYDGAGSFEPFWIDFGPNTDFVVQPDFSTLTPLIGSFDNTSSFNELINILKIKVGIPIDSVTDSGGVARFNYSMGTPIVTGETVNIKGFVVNTAYNVSSVVTADGSGYFEIASVTFGTDEPGGVFIGPNDRTLENVRLQFVSQSTGDPIYYYPTKLGWEEGNGTDLIADNDGMVTVDISNAPIALLINETVTNNYKIDSGYLLGDGVDPYQEATIQAGVFYNIITTDKSVTDLSDVTSAGSGEIITTAERNKLNGLTGGRYLGVFADLAALQTAYPTAVLGDTATVTSPNGNMFYWTGSAWADSGTGYVGDMLKAMYDPTGVDGDAFLRSNHSGTQLSSTISDFDAEVSGNASVTANTAKVSFPEAPNDSKEYARKNESWAEIVYPLNAVEYTEISADTTLDDYRNYIVDTKTPDATVTINIPYEETRAFTVRDMEKYFDKEECIITIRDSLDAIVHTATLDKKDKGWLFYNEGGTEDDWKYGEIGKGKIEDIASDHVASVDFGNLLVEDDDCTCATVKGGLMYENTSDMDDCDEALAHKKFVIDSAGVNTMNHSATANIDGLDVSSLSPLGVLFVSMTADRELKSLDGGTNGDIIHVVNLSAQRLKLKNDSGSDEKIRCPGTGAGLDINLEDYGGCTLVYNSVSDYWHVVGYAREWS